MLRYYDSLFLISYIIISSVGVGWIEELFLVFTFNNTETKLSYRIEATYGRNSCKDANIIECNIFIMRTFEEKIKLLIFFYKIALKLMAAYYSKDKHIKGIAILITKERTNYELQRQHLSSIGFEPYAKDNFYYFFNFYAI